MLIELLDFVHIFRVQLDDWPSKVGLDILHYLVGFRTVDQIDGQAAFAEPEKDTSFYMLDTLLAWSTKQFRKLQDKFWAKYDYI